MKRRSIFQMILAAFAAPRLRGAHGRTYRMDVSRPGDPMVVTIGPGGLTYQRQ